MELVRSSAGREGLGKPGISMQRLGQGDGSDATRALQVNGMVWMGDSDSFAQRTL